MKKFKIISLIILILLSIIFLFATCKKTNALGTGFQDYRIYISDRNPDARAYCTIYNIDYANSNQAPFNYVIGTNEYYYLYLSGSTLYIDKYDGDYSIIDSFVLSTGLIQVVVDYDVDGLYMIIYELSNSIQRVPPIEPVADGINRTLKARVNLGSDIESVWTTQDLMTIIVANDLLKFTFNYTLLESNFSLQALNNWVDNTVLNSLLFNYNLHLGYLSGSYDGYNDGYSSGVSDGEDAGYDIGYTEGYDDGNADGLVEGFDNGFDVGYNDGYHRGWDAGQAGETAITPVFSTLSSVFEVVGTVLAIELVPHVPLGIFILVPLFFAAVGLILWIWRRN